MKQQLDKNGCISINGQTVHLIDERVKEGIFVDTEDLTEPTWLFRESVGQPWKDPESEPSDRRFTNTPKCLAVRFKQPDRMEVQYEIFNETKQIWEVVDEEDYSIEHKYCDARKSFILKEKEGEDTGQKLINKAIEENLSAWNRPTVLKLMHDYARIQIDKDRESCANDLPSHLFANDDKHFATRYFITKREINLD